MLRRHQEYSRELNRREKSIWIKERILYVPFRMDHAADEHVRFFNINSFCRVCSRKQMPKSIRLQLTVRIGKYKRISIGMICSISFCLNLTDNCSCQWTFRPWSTVIVWSIFDESVSFWFKFAVWNRSIKSCVRWKWHWTLTFDREVNVVIVDGWKERMDGSETDNSNGMVHCRVFKRFNVCV